MQDFPISCSADPECHSVKIKDYSFPYLAQCAHEFIGSLFLPVYRTRTIRGFEGTQRHIKTAHDVLQIYLNKFYGKLVLSCFQRDLTLTV